MFYFNINHSTTEALGGRVAHEVPGSLFPDPSPRPPPPDHSMLHRLQNPFCLQARAATTIQLISMAFSASGSHHVCLVRWEGVRRGRSRTELRSWKCPVECPGPQSFTSKGTQLPGRRAESPVQSVTLPTMPLLHSEGDKVVRGKQ